MRTTTFTEFRRHAKAIFDAVEKGERVRVTRHGKPIADIVPVRSDAGTPSWKRPGLRLKIPGVSASEVILRERRESKR